VNPTRSANSTDTSRRSAAGDAAGAGTSSELIVTRDVPHSAQNFAPTACGVLHVGHASACGVPHSEQNFAPAATGLPQEPHGTVDMRATLRDSSRPKKTLQ